MSSARVAIISLGLVALGCSGREATEPADASPVADATSETSFDASETAVDASDAAADAADAEAGATPVSPCASGPLTIATAQANAYGIAVDDSFVFWATREDGVIHRWSKADSSVTELFSSTVDGPAALMRDGDRLYYAMQASSGDDGIWWMPRSGGAKTKIAPNVVHYSIGLDATHVYWIVGFRPGSIKRAPKAGGAVTDVVTAIDATPRFVAVHGSDVYWSELNRGNDAVYRAPIAGGDRTQILKTVGAAAIAIDDTGVYVGSEEGVFRVGHAGGTPTKLADARDAWGLAIDDVSVYFTDSATGEVKSVPKAGGAVKTIASGQKSPYYIAIDAKCVYWTNYADFSMPTVPNTGSVMCAPK